MEGAYQYEQWLSDGLGVSFKGQVNKWNEEQDADEVVKQIEGCSNLKFLELEGNSLGVGASKAIGKALESKQELEAALWKDLFTGRLKNEIPQSFNYLFAGVDLAGAHLQRLDLSDNAIGPVGMVGLGPFFRTASSFSLKELILNNNGFGPEGGSSLAEALLDCLRLSKESGGRVFQLRVFVCGRNRLENKAAKRLAEFFKQVGTLEEVHMPQNGIYKEGIAALSGGLQSNKNMRILNLNDNTIRGEGIVKLACAISDMTDLQDVSLSDCLLKSGVMKIINALKSHGTIKKINFSGNEISVSVGKQVAEALRSMRNLEEINLGSNNLGTAGVEFVTNMLNSINVVIEEDDGTEDEEDSDDGGGGEPSNVYEDISSAEDQEDPIDLKVEGKYNTNLKQSAVEIFLQNPTESNFLLLDKDSPYDVLKQHISDSKPQNVGYRYISLALQVSSQIDIERKLGKNVSECLMKLSMDLLSDGLQAGSCTANEFTTFLLMSTGIFRAEKDVVPSVFPLNNITLFCICKWLNERAVSRNIAFYLAVICRFLPRERAEQLPVSESVISKVQIVAETAYNKSCNAGSPTTIPAAKG